jgi:hypothetical protein
VAAGVTSLTCQEPTFTGPLPNRRSRPFSVTQLRIRNGSSCPIPAVRNTSKNLGHPDGVLFGSAAHPISKSSGGALRKIRGDERDIQEPPYELLFTDYSQASLLAGFAPNLCAEYPE